MKKYTLFSFVFILSLFLLGSNNVNVAKADDGCTGAGPYSTTTGQLCSTTPTAPTECAPGDSFSYITGQPCSATTTTNTPVTSTPTLQIGSRGSAVIAFQQMLANAGFLTGKIDGIYGKITSAAATNYYRIHPCPLTSGANGVASSNCGHLPIVPISTSPVTISSVSPNSIEFDINAKEGDSPDQTINITGSGFSSTNNEIIFIQGSTPQTIPNQTGKFEANSIEGGAYGPVAYIPQVSSNGNLISSLINNSQGASTGYVYTCGGGGGAGDGWRCPNVSLTDGSYVMYVKNANGDVSNGLPFTVTGIATTTTPSPTISGVSGPQTLNVNQSGTWTINASDPSNGNLSYLVNWGDTGNGSAMSNAFQQSATFTHSYGTAGTYSPTFTVMNASGKTAQTSLSATVSGTTTTTSQTPVINSLSTTSGSVGTQVTITGGGFNSNSHVNFGNAGLISSRTVSSDGTTITFTVPTSTNVCSIFGLCTGVSSSVLPGEYDITILNVNGEMYNISTSNALPFTVTSSTGTCLASGLDSTTDLPCGCSSTSGYSLITGVSCGGTITTSSNSISVFSPNGGEVWTGGTTHSITWQDGISGVQTDDISLVSPISNQIQTIAKGISGDSYSWNVGQVVNAGSNVISTALPSSYTIQVCKTGTNFCASSNAPFSVTTN